VSNVAVQRIPFTVTFKGFVEIEAHALPARDRGRKKAHLEAAFQWAKRVAQNAEAAVEHWLTSPAPTGRGRIAFGPPLKDLTYEVDLQDGYRALLREASGEEIY